MAKASKISGHELDAANDSLAESRSKPDAAAAIVEAIQKRALLQFHYNGLIRVVAPYCFGVSTRGHDVLRAIEVPGTGASHGRSFGKLWTVAKMTNPRVLDGTFKPNDPQYNPNDSAMTEIYCRI